MRKLTESELRAALVNASVRERKALHPPVGLDIIDWDRLDYLGWRDPKMPGVGYLVVSGPDVGDAIGIMLRATSSPPRIRPQCALCEDISLPNEVVMFSARRAGTAGRRGDTIGTLICAAFECSANVRRLPSSAMAGSEREAVRAARIEGLRGRVHRFVSRVVATGDSTSDR